MRRLLIGMLLVLAACAQRLPEPECDTNPTFAGAALTCEAAVAATLRALPADHPAIERIQFLYGSATPCCSRLYAEGEEQSVQGFVVFTYADDSERLYVPLAWWHDALSVGTPTPY
jgi:hypothetical protein